MNIEKLIEYLQLDERQQTAIDRTSNFPVDIPPRLLAKIEKKTLEDPLLKQFLPLKKECVETSGFSCDPLEEQGFFAAPNLLHKYHGRALIITSPACAMNCRFCFRRHVPKTSEHFFSAALDYIKNDSSISEVILSGGDPLSLTNERLDLLISSLDRIPHIKRIRLHTRYPVGFPERINGGFIEILKQCSKQLWFVIHTNHPNELGDDFFIALKKIQQLAIPVMTQTVLLQGINDEVSTLEILFSSLADNGIIPYYLHQLDSVQGAAHFSVLREKGRSLIAELSARLPGYAVPKYVEEIAGKPHKTVIP